MRHYVHPALSQHGARGRAGQPRAGVTVVAPGRYLLVGGIVNRTGLITGVGLLIAAALPLGVLPALAHSDGQAGVGDTPTATRGLAVADTGSGEHMRPVANLQYDDSGQAQSGSDIEFLKTGRREYALAGTLRKGMQIVDITDPTSPRIAAVYDCDISQGDIQVWRNDGRVLASYTADGTFGAAGAASQCARDLGLDAAAAGTVIVDLTRPARPQTVSFLPVPR